MTSNFVEQAFDIDRAKGFIAAADEMRTQHGWPDSSNGSQRRLMKAVLRNEYNGPLWLFFGPDGPFRGDADCQSTEAEEIKQSGLIKELFDNELSVFSEGGETSAAGWLTEFWLDGDQFERFKLRWRDSHSDTMELVERETPGRKPGYFAYSKDREVLYAALELYETLGLEKKAAIAAALSQLGRNDDIDKMYNRMARRKEWKSIKRPPM